MELTEQWLPRLQMNLDEGMNTVFAKNNDRFSEVTKEIHALQQVILEATKSSDNEANTLEKIVPDYRNICSTATTLLPNIGKIGEPFDVDGNNPKRTIEKIQSQMEHFQLLYNNELAKGSNLLDLSLKSYISISNIITDLGKTENNCVNHILRNSTAR